MLKKTFNLPLIGQLTMQGRRKTWEGKWLIPEFGPEGFNVTIYAELDGPTAAQQNVLQTFYQNRSEILDLIRDELLSCLNSGDWDIPDSPAITAENIWQFLSPEIITLDNPGDKRSYYGNGADMLLSIGWLGSWSEDYGIQVYLKNGIEFDGIGSE
ncbi:hypothetical protein H9Q10_09775 [Eikenella sp. S3360]|uniref:DUF2262 domain-containing protein n=1 Tax=Eikenella glucosivorans TaxID=2766967 RepID=A0ABS0NCB3_9NEIS|nr:hypothetical protein [Eikenella glucosivorans]MBH5329953.1 hypothetical protein [Eikenella glucosivorans]